MKTIKLPFVFMAVLLLNGMVRGLGQNNTISFTHYSVKDGFSSGIVYDILKDRYGFLWVATEDGLNRFNGSSVKVYRHDPARPGGLKANHITSLAESRDGNIWMGTNGGGISYYDRQKDSVFNFKPEGVKMADAVVGMGTDARGYIWGTGFGGIYMINPETRRLVTNGAYNKLLLTLKGKVSTCFFEDHKKNIYIGTNNGLVTFNPATQVIQVFNHIETDVTSLAGGNINEITGDARGNIWIGTANGLSKLAPGSVGFTNYREVLPSLDIEAIEADSSNNQLWIGTQEGLTILNIATGAVTNYLPDNRNARSLSSRSIRSIMIEKNGVYWVGTFRGGLNKYDKNFSYFGLKDYNAFDSKGLRAPIVTAFAAYNNDVYVGTDGGGLQLYHRNTGLMDYISLPMNNNKCKHDLSILTMEATRAGVLWIGSFMNGLYRYNPGDKSVKQFVKGNAAADLNNNDIFCVKEDHMGNIWAGTNGSGINIIRPGKKEIDKYVLDPALPANGSAPSSNYIRVFEEDNDGNMWIGTFGGGISVFNPERGKFTYYTRENAGLPSNYVLTIKKDARGDMWIGTSGNGIGLLKKGQRQFVTFSEKDGLQNAFINKIVEDRQGKLWLSTNSGLTSYDPFTGKFKNYSTNSGLQAGAFTPRAGEVLPDGEIFFGGQNGFNHFYPADLKTNKNIPQVVLTDLKVDNQLVTPAKDGPIALSLLLAHEVKLKYKQSFSIGFEALDFTVPEANQYQYKLENFDKDWTSPGKEHSAYYTNIPPGEYVFKVRASNNDGLWNTTGRSIKVVVAPPFWLTPWALFVYVLLIAATLLYLRKRAIRKIRTRLELEQERRQAKQLIEQERKEAEYLHKLDQVKIKFLTNLSHEFRTPISLILGPVDNLIGQVKTEASLNQLNLIKRNTKRLLNLVNQLLDFRKMEEQELKLQCHEGDIVYFMEDICDSFNDLARQKRISLHFQANPASLQVLFDHAKIERILFNLLSNAFKFTPENGSISVALEETGNAGGEGFTTLAVSVKDSGIGIPEDAQTRIFESFFQHTANPEILNQGTGIGLAITRELVNVHNGIIWVESREGEGSCFTFTLKLRKACANTTLPATDEARTGTFVSEPYTHAQTPGSHSSILIVEDDDDFRFYLKENLKNIYRIHEAVHGKDGWQKALFHHPDIIVCDIQMPVMNGLELVQKLKADKRTRHIPVILLTAANTPSGAVDGLESGAIDYMTKPFDFSVLQAKINNILTLNQAFKETYSKQVTVQVPETEAVSEKDKFLQSAIHYIFDNLDNPQLSVENLSTHLFISRASLYNRILEYTGVTPVEFIRNVKLEKAKDLLEKTDMSITDIAYKTGFSNPNYFTKVFKSKYSLTPSEFQSSKKKYAKDVAF